MTKKTIKDLGDIAGKRLLVRVDFNVPLDEKRNITDDTRIRASLPTIKYLINAKAKTILISHLGRPSGIDEKLRMNPVQGRLSELLGKPVLKLDDCIGEEVENAIPKAKNGDVILLENVRFYSEEEKNDEIFARKLASLADIYVNDAFGTAHRAHASTAGIAEFLPGVAGLLMEKEIEVLGNLLTNPKRPFVAILGGAKIGDKINVITNLLSKVNILIVGGGMAYTFFKARGVPVGKSIVDQGGLDLAKAILKKAIDLGVPFLLPIDHIIADKISPEAKVAVVHRMGIPADSQAVDIGPDTVEKFGHALENAKTIFWNGPLGVFEIEAFAKGTIEVARLVAAATDRGATTVVGGGDTIAAIEKAGVTDKITHVSTGGGASLEFLEGKVLPGIACLQDK